MDNFARKRSPGKGSFFAPDGVGCLRRCSSNAPEARCNLRSRIRRSAGHIFSVLAEKIWKKRPLERFYRAVAQKRHFDSACRSPIVRPARNALRAAVESGFPSARYAVRVVLFAPVEYLTYGSRKAVLFARAALRITKNGLPFKSQLKQPQSISITSPVYQRRICSAFCKSESISAQAKPRG